MSDSKLNVTDEELQHLYEPIAVRDKHIEALEAELAERLEWNKTCIESAAIASAEISKLQAENEELRVLVDSAKPIVELSTVGKGWRDDWLKNARNILKQ